MRVAIRPIAMITSAAYLLAACTTALPQPTELGSMSFSDTRPVALKVTVAGKVAPVLQSGTTGRLVMTRDGEPGAIGIDFQSGAIGIYELPPGNYSIVMIGPLECTGLTVELAPGGGAVALGSLTAKISENDNYDVALMSGVSATDAELAGIAQGLKAAPETIVSQPFYIPNSALCHHDRFGKGQVGLTNEEAVQVATGLTLIGAIAFIFYAAAAVAGVGGQWR